MFPYRITHFQTKPARTYFWESEVSPLESGFLSFEDAAEFADESVRNFRRKPFSECDYILQFIWIDKEIPILEVVGYSDVNMHTWPAGNPERHEWVFMGKKYKEMPKRRQVGCEFSTIIMGKEAEYRRNSNNPTEYILHPPELGYLNPSHDYIFDEEGLQKKVLAPRVEK